MATTRYIDGIAQPKVYRAIISQSGTDAPVPIIIENTLGFEPTWGYLSSGSYSITAVGKFIYGKTYLSFTPDNAGMIAGPLFPNDSYVIVTPLGDDNIFDTMIEILIYP